MLNWEELKENNTLEDFYNILCRNSKRYKEWGYLESITYEELLNNSENIKECDKIINEIIEYLKSEKMEVLKNYE